MKVSIVVATVGAAATAVHGNDNGGPVSLFNGAGSFTWSAEPFQSSVIVNGKLEIDIGKFGNDAPWMGIGSGAFMLGSNYILGFPSQNTFPGQSSESVSEYSIPENIIKDNAAQHAKELGLQSRSLISASYVKTGAKATMTFSAHGIAGKNFTLTSRESFMFAIGSGTEFGYHGLNAEVKRIDWSTGLVQVSVSESSNMYIVHGVCMIVGFGFIFPLGAMFSVFRDRFNWEEGKWFVFHKYFQFFGMVCAFAALAVILTVPNIKLANDSHGVLGLALLSAVLVQVFSSFIFRKGKTRPVWRVSHVILALFIFIGGVINSFEGLEKSSIVLRGTTASDILPIILYISTAFTGICTLFVFHSRYLAYLEAKSATSNVTHSEKPNQV